MATCSVPTPSTRSAVSGRSAARASRALDAWPIAFISCQWPSSITSISSTSSHQKSRSSTSASLARLEAKATVIAREIRSIMPGVRSRSSFQPPFRKGEPP